MADPVTHLDVGPGVPSWNTFADNHDPSGATIQNAIVHPYNQPYTGNNGTSTSNAYRTGRIVGLASPNDTKISRFFFHYNPQSVTVSNMVNPDVRSAADMPTPKVFNDVLQSETLSFDLLLNRMPDVALGQRNTSTRAHLPVNAQAMAYGTLHDLYYLFGVINQNFGDPIIHDNDFPYTDTGLLFPNPVTIIFGELFRFVGVVQQIDIQHAKFIASPMSTPTSAPLIPVLTTVTVSVRRLPPTVSGSLANNGGGNGGGTDQNGNAAGNTASTAGTAASNGGSIGNNSSASQAAHSAVGGARSATNPISFKP